jgi:hypothetical protein
MLHAMSPICHLVDPLLEGLSDPGILTDIHCLHLLDHEAHKQTKDELAHLLSSLTRHADQSPMAVSHDMRVTRANYVLADCLNKVKD